LFLFLVVLAKTQEVAEKPKGEMKVKVVIDKPEIIMIENQANEDTRALMLDVSFRSGSLYQGL